MQFVMPMIVTPGAGTPGVALALEGGVGCGHDPLFSGHSALPSLPIYHQCAAHVPLIFNFLEKFCIFNLVFD